MRRSLLRFDEEPHLGAPETVDRLHRIADGEQRAPVVRLPAGRQPTDQLELCERRVLEFVDQQVSELKIELEQQVRRRVLRPERIERGQRGLREVDRAGIAKGHRQLRRRPRKDVERARRRSPMCRRCTGAAADGARCAAPRRAAARPRERRAGAFIVGIALRGARLLPSPIATGGKALQCPRPSSRNWASPRDEQPIDERPPPRLRGDRPRREPAARAARPQDARAIVRRCRDAARFAAA